MDVKQAIEERRSIRKYQDKEVPEEFIKEMLEAARLAPSGNNAQPWLYKVIKDSQQKEKLRENEIFKQEFVYEAPVIIVCCANPEAYPKAKFEEGFDDSYESRAARDLTIATDHLVLRATELGLGTCWVGWMEKNKIKDVLNIPKDYVVPYVITVGYAAQEPKPLKRKSIDEIIL
ncbi:MAG: nitroreductase family protein [Candidatus Woesearchaeota archaeon]